MKNGIKLLIVFAVLFFLISPTIAHTIDEIKASYPLFTLGTAEINYSDGKITCYNGTLYPGMPVYWCGYMQNEQFVMIHSYFANQVPQMNIEMSGASTSTYTAQPIGR